MTSTWVNQLRKGIDIGAYQLLQPTMFQDICYDFVFVFQLLQHFLRGDILACLRLLGLFYYLQFIEEDLTYLLR